MDDKIVTLAGYGPYMAGLRDCLALVRYRARHIETEVQDPKEFIERMKVELEMVAVRLEEMRGSQLSDILTDGG